MCNQISQSLKITVAFFLLSLFMTGYTASGESLESLAQRSITHKAYPGFCIQVGNRHAVLLNKCYGDFSYKNKHKDTVHSSFDIASLTKILATTSDIMRLYDQGKISLSDKASQYLPEQTSITVQELLDHSSGLPAGIKLPATREAVLHIKPVHTPGKHYTYSDLNFIWLQHIVEKISGKSFAEFTQQNVFIPLAMNHTEFYPLKVLSKSNIVPTALDGIVDDPLSRNFGGIAGNAGVFTTVNDIGKYARVLLNQGRYQKMQWVKPSTIALFTRRDVKVKRSTRALGFDTVYNPKIISSQPHQFSAGQYIDPNAFGHTGYTGTSLWVSPQDDLYMVFLSNRVNLVNEHMPRRDKYWRQRIASWVWQHYGHLHKNQTYTETGVN